jgi:uncharacterized SAM-binding protein YcdF (DUF218 family)
VSDELPTERERRTEEQRLRDRRLIEQVENRRTVGEELARTGEIPPIDRPAPAIPTQAGSDRSSRDPHARATPDRTPPGGSRTPVAAPRPAPRHRVWPRVLQVAAGLFAVVVIYFLFCLWQVWSTGRSDQARAVDAIVVMGAAQYDGTPSPQLAARLDHVVELAQEGLAPLIIVTGGNRPGDRFTEADASAAYLVEHGVAASSIRKEDAGTSSYESLAGVADILEGEQLHSVLIVTDPYHALRSRMIADDLGLEAYTSPTPTSIVKGAHSFERQLGEAAGVAVGRVIGFDRLDDLTD